MGETNGLGWDYFHAKNVEWLEANKKVATEVRWGSFPLGMVARWIDRAERAEADLAAHNSDLVEALREIRDSKHGTQHCELAAIARVALTALDA